MGMTVRNNQLSLNANRQMGINNQKAGNSLKKLASGYKINSAADDSAGLAISQKMMAQLRGLNTASGNAQDGISLVQTADSALGSVHDMLGRISELAGRASNGTLGESERSILQKEVDSLVSEIDRVSKSTNFNGKNLLDGSAKGGIELNIGDSSRGYDKARVSIGDMSAAGLGIDKIDLTSQEGASAALESLRSQNGAINQVSSVRADLGATQNRLEHTINNLGVSYENLMSANSRIRDTDIADQMIMFTQNQLMRNISQSMIIHGNVQSQSILHLLR